MVPVSPSLAWRWGLPGTPTVAFELAHQTRLLLRLRGRRLSFRRSRGGSGGDDRRARAGLDVHKAQVTACVRVPGQGRERAQEVAEFQTTVGGLLLLRDWLQAHRVTEVAMEATGVYWKPVVRHEVPFDLVGMKGPHLRAVAAVC